MFFLTCPGQSPSPRHMSRWPQDYLSSKDWSSDPCELTDRMWKTTKAAAFLCQKCPTHSAFNLPHLYLWIVLIALQFFQLMLTVTGPAAHFNRGSYLTWPNRNGLPDGVLPRGIGMFSLLQRNVTCCLRNDMMPKDTSRETCFCSFFLKTAMLQKNK